MSIVLENLYELSPSTSSIQVIHTASLNNHKIPKAFTPELIDSLRKNTTYFYLFSVTFYPEGNLTNDIYINRNDFIDNTDSELYLDNHVSVTIKVFNIPENKQIYKQVITANEMIDSENSLEDDESNILFTRSRLNIAKSALIKGLRDLKKHSKKG